MAHAESIVAAVRDKPVVFVCVTGPDAQRAVFDEGLLDCLGPGVLVIELDHDRSGPLGAAATHRQA